MKTLDMFLWVTIIFLYLCIIACFVFAACFGHYPEELISKLIIYTLGEGGICGLIKAVKVIFAEREVKAQTKSEAETYQEENTERTE